MVTPRTGRKASTVDIQAIMAAERVTLQRPVLAQGWLFADALPADEVTAWLADAEHRFQRAGQVVGLERLRERAHRAGHVALLLRHGAAGEQRRIGLLRTHAEGEVDALAVRGLEDERVERRRGVSHDVVTEPRNEALDQLPCLCHGLRDEDPGHEPLQPCP